MPRIQRQTAQFVEEGFIPLLGAPGLDRGCEGLVVAGDAHQAAGGGVCGSEGSQWLRHHLARCLALCFPHSARKRTEGDGEIGG